MRKNSPSASTPYVDIMEKTHMEIPWHNYADADSHVIIRQAGLIEKSSVIGRVGLIMLSCGTGAWRHLYDFCDGTGVFLFADSSWSC